MIIFFPILESVDIETLYGSDEKLLRKKDEYQKTFSVHGLTKICTGSKAESIFWIIILLSGLSVSILLVYRLVRKYLQFNIYTEVTEIATNQNTFPAITFCDYNLMLASYFAYCGTLAGASHPNPKNPCDASRKKKKISNDSKKVPVKDGRWSSNFYNVVKCHSWGSKSCNSDKYLTSLTQYYHACFTWNYNGDFHDAYGHAFLMFEVNETFTKQHSYIVALVHDPRVKELDMTNRVILEPKKTYELRIVKTILRRLPSPYPSNCTAGKPIDVFPGKYTRRTCIESKVFLKMLKKCGDVPDHVAQYIPQHIKQKYATNNSVRDVLKCIYGFQKEEIEIATDCVLPCEEMELMTMLSSHEMNGKQDGNKSIYRVDIQYQNVDTYRVVAEKKLFSWDQVIGEVGGLLGLVIGASFMSVIEIIAYLYLSCIDKIKSRFRVDRM